MDYKITYRYEGLINTVLLQDNQNLLGAIHQFITDHNLQCEIVKVEEY